MAADIVDVHIVADRVDQLVGSVVVGIADVRIAVDRIDRWVADMVVGWIADVVVAGQVADFVGRIPGMAVVLAGLDLIELDLVELDLVELDLAELDLAVLLQLRPPSFP